MEHHPDCDGWRAIRGTVVPAGSGFVIDGIDGKRMPGFFSTIGQAEAAVPVQGVECAGECRAWDVA